MLVRVDAVPEADYPTLFVKAPDMHLVFFDHLSAGCLYGRLQIDQRDHDISIFEECLGLEF